MKSLVQFIKEAENEKKKRVEIRVEVKGMPDADSLIDEISNICSSKDIYSEKIDNGIKFFLQGDDVEKYASLKDALSSYKDKHEEAESLNGAIEKIEKWSQETSETDENDEKDKKKEEE